jgi:class 3 adenylate cyclase/tetratricopeptide (TPR) repeat protein
VRRAAFRRHYDGAEDATVIETVTVMFTDLLGSTELSSRVGPEVADVLRSEHLGLLSEAIAEHGGRQVKNLGDGVMAVFPSASAAVDGAVALQQRFQRRNRRADHALLVRVGVAVGEASSESGDYFGTPVIEAARVCASAAGGQVRVTDMVKVMASRSRHRFDSLGPVDLKGLPEPVTLYEVTWEETSQRTALPPRLRSVPAISFVGRGAERERLGRWWQETREGGLRVVLVSGVPGIGKTRLATHTALLAADDGAAVLYGHCDEDLGAPYQPWLEALAHLVAAAPADELRQHAERHGGELARLVPQLAALVPHAPPAGRRDPETERYLLFAAVLDLLEMTAARQPLVVVLDDLHWADKPTLALLRHLIASAPELPAFVIGTYRSTDLPRGHPLAQTLADLRREPVVERLALTGLEEADILALLERVTGQEMDEGGERLAGELWRETDGNPFFVAELLRSLVESGAAAQGADGRWSLTRPMSELGLPESLREVVGRRIERLGPETERALCAAAVIGRDFELPLLALVLGQEEDELLDRLDDAVQAAVLVEQPGRPGHFAFAHRLIEHALYDALGPTRRARLHRKVAKALEALCGADPAARLGELAHHWAHAMQIVDVEKAVGYACRAGRRALDQLAPDEAVRWFARGLELLDGAAGADDGMRCELLLGLGEGQRQVGEADYRETLLGAAELARGMGDVDRLARAVLANNRGFTSEIGIVDEERVAMLEAAATVLPLDDARRADVLALLAMELTFAGDAPRRRALAREALAAARRHGDAESLAHVINRALFAIWLPETLAERLDLSAELIVLAEASRDPFLRAMSYNRRIYDVIEAGLAGQADACAGATREIADAVPQPFLGWVSRYMQALVAILHGELDRAEMLAEEAVAAGTESGQPDALMIFAAQLVGLRREQGRLDEVLDLIKQAVEDNPGVPAWGGFLMCTLCELGRHDQARALLDATDLDAVPQDFLLAATLAYYAEACAALGVAEMAAELYARLDPFRGQCITNGVGVLGAVSHFLGRLAATAGRHDDADRDFAEAAELHRRLEAPVMLARTQMAWATALLAGGRPEDAERAGRLLASALAAARAHGAWGVARAAESVLAAHGMAV